MNRLTWTAGILLLLLCLGWVSPWPAGPVAKEQKAQTNCPVMGFSINRNIYTDYKDKRVYFCCPFCPPEFSKKPDFYMTKMIEHGVVPEDAPLGNS